MCARRRSGPRRRSSASRLGIVDSLSGQLHAPSEFSRLHLEKLGSPGQAGDRHEVGLGTGEIEIYGLETSGQRLESANHPANVAEGLRLGALRLQ
jgi:hypothetical protein